MPTSFPIFERLSIGKCDAFPIGPWTLSTIQVDDSVTHHVTANKLTGVDSFVSEYISSVRYVSKLIFSV